eukprot:365784-Chlamydomonas_euryale.AAC.1
MARGAAKGAYMAARRRMAHQSGARQRACRDTGLPACMQAHTHAPPPSHAHMHAFMQRVWLCRRKHARLPLRRVDVNGKRRPPFPFPRRKRPFPCGNGTAVSMWKRDVVSPAARACRQELIVWAALP